MTLTAVLILILSACVHAGWNLLGKRSGPSPAMFLAANMLGGLCLLPVAILYSGVLPKIPLNVWLFLVLTGAFQAIYYAALSEAYRVGDLSLAYPLVKSIPVLLVAIWAVLLGRAGSFSGLYWLGVGLVVIGCLTLPFNSLRELNWKNLLSTTTFLALAAAVGTAGYSIVDDAALRVLRTVPDIGASVVALTVVYAFFESLTSSIWLAGWVLLRRSDRVELKTVMRLQLGQAGLVGVGICLAYTLVLVAMGFVTNVSYVVSFRQLSVPLGALAGVLILKEPWRATRVAGMLLAFAGLVLVGFG